LDDPCTEEVRDAKVDLLMNPKVEVFNQYMNQIKTESGKFAECLLEITPERWPYALFRSSWHGQYLCNMSNTIVHWMPSKYELSVVHLVDTIRCKLTMVDSIPMNALTAGNQKLLEEMSKAQSLITSDCLI
jgi:hypothetical protein